MTSFNILVKTLDDTTPSWPDLLNEKLQQGIIEGVSILEAGTAAGLSSVAFRIKLADGSFALVETTGGLLKMLHSALLGAEARFADLKT